jgi:hypothetical protein
MPMKDGELMPYGEGEKPSNASVNEALGISMDPKAGEYDADWAKMVLKNATKEQKADARKQLNVPDGMNMGGVVKDELGYMGGGISYSDRGPIKYSKGGAVSGKNFRGSF